jgi:hypothetical protein
MAQYYPLLMKDPDTTFDLATTAMLETAYDRAIAELHDRGSDSVREAVARRMVALASVGERDLDLLCDKALVAAGFLL